MKKKTTRKNKTLIIVLIISTLISAGIFYLVYLASSRIFYSSRAQSATSILSNTVASEAFFQNNAGVVRQFNIYTQTPGQILYKTRFSGLTGVIGFLKDNPMLSGVVFSQTTSTLLNNTDFVDNLFLIRQNGNDFDFEERINGVPVLFSYLGVHRGDRGITALYGNLLDDTTVKEATLTLSAAEKIAIDQANLNGGSLGNLETQARKVIFNAGLVDTSEQDSNHIAADIEVFSATSPVAYRHQFVIDLIDGQILFEQNRIPEAATPKREIYNCAKGGSCPLVRDDVSKTTATGDREADRSYDIIGDVFKYYSEHFSRNSYDNRGSPMRAYVHYISGGGFKCPNAAWTGQEMLACSGMIAKDVWAHEFTHGVTSSTANLNYRDQSGALNESFSDIFGAALDPEDWQMGEEIEEQSIPHPIRYMDDPPKRDDPDRLFSPLYECSMEQRKVVHTNSGILNKAFYLMVAGGNFNGCSITGIGWDKATAVIYRALTQPGYLHATSNFKDTYDAIVAACNDAVSSPTGGANIVAVDCASIKAALQSVEINQQPARSQAGPICGGGAGHKIPECAGSAIPPTPTAPLGPTETIKPTRIPTNTPTPTPASTTTPPQPTATLPSPTMPAPTGVPTPTSGELPIILNLKLRFQGISTRPAASDKISVRCSLGGGSLPKTLQQVGAFQSDDKGIWSGTVLFNAPAGSGYKILCKGPRHIQKKFCDVYPKESYPGSYLCDRGNITLLSGENNLDFTNVLLLVGDLPVQDGVVNGFDIALIRNNLGARRGEGSPCDLNLDGICNTQDYSLMLEALSTRKEEF